MYRQRATLVTLESLRTLTKVCCRPRNFSLTLRFCRNFSHANERVDFVSARYESNGEDCTNNFQQNQFGYGNVGRSDSSEPTVNRVYGQNPRNDFQHNQTGNIPSGNMENGPKNEIIGNHNRENGRLSSGYIDLGLRNGNFEGHNGLNGKDARQPNGYGYDRGSSVDLWQNANGNSYGQSVSESSGHGSWQYGEVSGGFKQTPSVGYSDGNYGNSQQNWNGYYTQSVGMHNYYAGNGGNLPVLQGSNAGNFGTYHSNTGVLEGYSNVEECQQRMSGNYQSGGGFNQQASFESENGYVASQGVSSGRLNEESVEAVEGGQLRGTIEELDKFLQEGKLKETLEVLGLLEGKRILVDLPRYLCIMKACGEERALEEAKAVHEHLLRSGLHLEVKTFNKILEMYCRCGSVDDAFKAFNDMPKRNLTSWDSMISWLAQNGYEEDAIALFAQFKETGLRPDGRMFLGVFSACGIVGDIVEGLLHFESMSKDYAIVPSMEHYVSVVNMMGTAGHLDEALEFTERMPLEPSSELWEVLMNLCRMHGNLELGDRCAEIVEVLDPSRLDEHSRAGLLPLRPSDLASEKQKKKLSGQSFPEGRSRVHEYRAGDRSQPELYELLKGLRQQLKEAGYIPEVKFVLHDIDQEGKEEALMAHSERLAVAQGLLTSPARYPMRIIKNLRICVDCHNTMKIISKLVGRELIIRDAKRFHHFKDGACSCRDYW